MRAGSPGCMSNSRCADDVRPSLFPFLVRSCLPHVNASKIFSSPCITLHPRKPHALLLPIINEPLTLSLFNSLLSRCFSALALRAFHFVHDAATRPIRSRRTLYPEGSCTFTHMAQSLAWLPWEAVASFSNMDDLLLRIYRRIRWP